MIQADTKYFSRTLSVKVMLAGIIGVAVVLRLASAIYQGDAVAPLPGIYDQISYDELARRVISGHGFTFPVAWWPMTQAGAPTAHWSFLYTLYLAAVYLVFGLHPLAARVVQAIIAGILYPWLSYRLGRRLFGGPVGLAAAAISALYPYFVYYGGALMTETFYILAVLWALDLTMEISQRREVGLRISGVGFPSILGTAKPWLLLGLALGLATLLRQLILFFVPFLFAWLLWVAARRKAAGESGSTSERLRPMLAGMLASVVVIAALIAPWTVRNYFAFHRFVPLNTNSGYAFFWGNNPIYGTNFVPILPDGMYQQLIPTELRGLDEAALDQALLVRGIGFVVADPWRYLQLSASRVKYYFEFWPSAESGTTSNVARVLSFGVLLPLSLLGMLMIAVRRRYVQHGQWPAVGLLVLFMVVYSMMHILSWALIRYRLPVDATLVLFAAVPVQSFVSWLVRGRLGHLVGLGTADAARPLPSLPDLAQIGATDRGDLAGR